jgi:enediyne polyketide synthase
MMTAIAVVGMACRYPDAQSPLELWENVLVQRRAFRRMPSERLRLEDYFNPNRTVPDCTYSTEVAVIEGYEFDRVRFRISGSTFRSSDLAHWLALDIASQALTDAGFSDSTTLPQESTGVFLGNTLTGEFSRANSLRLRWPYIRRVVEAVLTEEGWTAEQCQVFLERLELAYKEPFAPVGEETLAGGLSNTIAGRICNHFDLKGGGYTVDGACASSLLAIATACSSLVTHDIDLALAGGVDVSLDPFELVGFAKSMALATEEMRVYDARSAGFWPGEGCGFAVLMRYEDALAQQRRIYAVIRGWGISSDGNGGITRPEVEGQSLALSRAYIRAGFDIGSVVYFEGHGTGTSVGDTTELQTLSRARREAASPAAIGSIKANIGHTKAAAGVAGFIKATMAVFTQLLPPTTGSSEPHAELRGEEAVLQVLDEGKLWPNELPLRAGVSAMGFGGINSHVVLEGIVRERRTILGTRERILLSSAQDAELFLIKAEDSAGLQQQVEHLLTIAPRLSRAELADVAAQLEKTLQDGLVRAAIVASTPSELAARLETLRSWLAAGITTRLDISSGVFLGEGASAPRIGFLFPGQGSPAHLSGGALRRRFAFVRELYAWANLPSASNSVATEVAQPAIVTASMAALRTLRKLGMTASIGVGHSLGELTALHWAGVLDEEALLRIATVRGKAMADLGNPTGAMASIMAERQEVEGLLNGERVVVAGVNSPRQTVISGEANEVDAVVARARTKNLRSVNLRVSHAFHSPLVVAAVKPLAEHLTCEDLRPLQFPVVSTVTGASITPNEDIRDLLCRQVTLPVRFLEAATKAAEGTDLLIEVGPGQVLGGLVSEFLPVPVISLDAGGPSLKGLLQAGGAAFVLGAPMHHAALFANRFTRPFDLNWHPRFFGNPCELAPLSRRVVQQENPEKVDVQIREDVEKPVDTSPRLATTSPIELVRRLVAERAELPTEAVKDENHLLSDLHLNSITVGQLVAEASRSLGLLPPVAPTDYADATVAEVAKALEELARTGSSTRIDEKKRTPPGVDVWIRPFTVEPVERPLPQRKSLVTGRGVWQIIALPDYPFTASLEQAFASYSGKGVIVCLPPEPDEHHVSLLLEGAHLVLAEREATHFILVQHGGGGEAFARTLYLEAPKNTTCVVDVPVDHPQVIEWVLAEAKAARGYSEASYDTFGRRREPVLRLLSLSQETTELLLGPDDVLLVTGGGKGIAAECAFSLARETGVRLALLGRSQPSADHELQANLNRIAAADIHFQYLVADVTDADAVQTAIREAEARLGPVTAILHGAGTNVPKLLSALDETVFLNTLRPKVQGARNVLAALDPDKLRLFVTFSSIIARTGMRGEADYGLANDWLARLTERFQMGHPSCRCLAVEWSVWSGVGMGERLGRVDALMQEGITPIPPDEGISLLRHLIAQPLPAVRVAVAGRLGETPTLKVEQAELPFLRFLEQTRVYYPGVELVSDVELSTETDPYVDDHMFHGERLLPAVIGLEAMAQSTMALTGCTDPPVFEDVRFNRPIVVPEMASVTIRVAALMREPDLVEVVVRSEETAFQVDHFCATCRFKGQGQEKVGRARPGTSVEFEREMILALDPDRDLYGGILFHRGRFQCLRNYRQLQATECFAEIGSDGESNWFGRYLPTQLVLGDPAARDAAIHAIQACIPHATLLPIGVDRLVSYPAAPHATGSLFVHAKERRREGDLFIYDMEVIGTDGYVQERWEGLRLRLVGKREMREAWVEPLLGPYIERRVQELIPGASVTVVVQRDSSSERHLQGDQAVQQMLGPTVSVQRRPDGKPELESNGKVAVSVSHANGLTMAIASPRPVGCDIEPVQARPPSLWQDLLGSERYKLAKLISQEGREDQDTAATRVWAASECLKKVGAMITAPLVLNSSGEDGWTLLAAGPFITATYAAAVRGVQNRLVLAVTVRGDDMDRKRAVPERANLQKTLLAKEGRL